MEATEQQRDGDIKSYEHSYFQQPLTPVSKQQLEMNDWSNDICCTVYRKRAGRIQRTKQIARVADSMKAIK